MKIKQQFEKFQYAHQKVNVNDTSLKTPQIQSKKLAKIQSKQLSLQQSTSTISPLFHKPTSKEEWFSKAKFIKEDIRQYIKLFENYIRKEKYWQPLLQQKMKQYQLIEDISLLYFANMDPEHATLQFFQNLIDVGFFPNRNAESLKERYKRFLKYLTHDDIIKLGTFLVEEGANGCLLFRKHEGTQKKTLVYIEKTGKDIHYSTPKERRVVINPDPKTPRSTALGKKHLFTEESPSSYHPGKKIKCVCNLQNFKQFQKLSCKTSQFQDLTVVKPQIEAISTSSMKPTENFHLHVTMDFETKGRTIKKDFSYALKSFNEKVKWFQKEFKIDRQQLQQYLDQTNGDFGDLFKYLRSKDPKYIWTSDEDKILQNSNDIKEPAIKMLLRYKGYNGIKRRIQYKEIQKDFF